MTSLRTRLALAATALLWLAPAVRADEEVDVGDPLPSRRGELTLKLEGGVALPLTDPQSELFDVGGSQTVKGLWSVQRYVDLGPSVGFLFLPTDGPGSGSGTAWTFGGSVRLKRPHDVRAKNALGAMSPWVDVDAMYVRTGDLDRPGFAIGAGLAVPIDHARTFWLGPFVRYFHIIQGERGGYDDHDAKVLTVGLSLEVGAAVERRREPVVVVATPAPAPAPAPVPEPRVVTKEVAVCPDRDADGIPDGVDHCPEVAGPMDSFGCPAYKKVVVKKDKLELKEKIAFAYNSANLEGASSPVLDDVVQALKDNKGFRVQIEGHTSSEGGDGHNQTLSEQRAKAVLDYLVAHGIGAERLISKGFASTVPIDTNKTSAGREKNRRVEFVVNFIRVEEGNKP